MNIPIEPGMIVEVVRPQYSIKKGEELEVIAVSQAMDGCSCINALRCANNHYIAIPLQNVIFKRIAPPKDPASSEITEATAADTITELASEKASAKPARRKAAVKRS